MTNSLDIVSSVASLIPESGGPSRSTSALCDALAGLGVRIGLMSLDFGIGCGAPILPGPAVQTELVPCRFFQRLRFLWAPRFESTLLSRVRSSRARLLHDNGLWLTTNHAAANVSRKCALPLIVSTRGMLTPWAIRYKSWKKSLAWGVYQHRDLLAAKVIHATSDDEARGIRQIGLHQPLAIIPNGVDFPPAIEPRPCRTYPRTALFLGRIHPVKGLLNLVQAWAKTSPAGWRMVIAGPDENGHRAEVDKAINEAQLTDHFSFVGAVSGKAKAALYGKADLFILPSFTENFGLSIAEALTYGVPVITTKGTPWCELQSRKAGWWIDSGVDPLARCLAEATAISDSERIEMGARGRKFAEERFSWRKIACDMNAVYEWMLGNGNKPGCVVDP